ncbi:MAG TPA: hypothetical protein VHM25_04880 [Polyangiaceae bacterium]|jgi:hypothetical protein|nr:hypothetical protein [Polyangiaceae bacterium]
MLPSIDMRAWLGVLMVTSALCAGCGNDCSEVADLMRQCCAKGPAELRAACEAEAQRLEDDGNADACEDTKPRLAGCRS